MQKHIRGQHQLCCFVFKLMYEIEQGTSFSMKDVYAATRAHLNYYRETNNFTWSQQCSNNLNTKKKKKKKLAPTKANGATTLTKVPADHQVIDTPRIMHDQIIFSRLCLMWGSKKREQKSKSCFMSTK